MFLPTSYPKVIQASDNSQIISRVFNIPPTTPPFRKILLGETLFDSRLNIIDLVSVLMFNITSVSSTFVWIVLNRFNVASTMIALNINDNIITQFYNITPKIIIDNNAKIQYYYYNNGLETRTLEIGIFVTGLNVK